MSYKKQGFGAEAERPVPGIFARSRIFFKLGAGAGFFSSSEPEPDLAISTRHRNPAKKIPLCTNKLLFAELHIHEGKAEFRDND